MEFMSRKIAFIVPHYYPSRLPGSVRVIAYIARSLVKDREDVTIITSDVYDPAAWYGPFFGRYITKKREKIDGVTVIRLSVNWLQSALFLMLSRYARFALPNGWKDRVTLYACGPIFRELESCLQNEKFDIIHASPFPMGFIHQIYDIKYKKRMPFKFILTPFTHTLIDDYSNHLLASVLKSADAIHTVTETESNYIKSVVAKPKISMIPLFLMDDHYPTHDALYKLEHELYERYNLNGKIIILFAGNKGRFKGIFHLIEAVSILNQVDQKYVLVAIGQSTPDWPKTIQEKYRSILLDLPYQTEEYKYAWFDICHIYAMPSISESFGLVYLDAWHFKKPVIAADIPAERELILGAQGGILVKYGDIHGLASAIRKLSIRKDLRETYGQNGYNAVERLYKLNYFMSEYRKLLVNILSKK